jgi:hypothetical protein
MTPTISHDDEGHGSRLRRGSYIVRIPITPEGLLIKVGSPNIGVEKLMPTFSCTFQGYRNLSDGTPGEVENKQLIQEVGDWIVEIEENSTENMSLMEVLECLKSNISNKKKMNADVLQVTFQSCSAVFEEYREEVRKQKQEEQRKQSTKQIDKFSEDRKKEIKAKDRLRKQMKRSNMSYEEREEERAKSRKYKNERRRNQTEEEKEQERVKSRIYTNERRRNRTEEEKEEERVKSRRYTNERRMNQTEEEKEEERAKSRRYTNERRRNQTEEEKEEERVKSRIYHNEKRKIQTEEDMEEERARLRSYLSERRRNQTEEEKEEDRRRSREYKSEMRANQRRDECTPQLPVDHNYFIGSNCESAQNFDLTGNVHVESSMQSCSEKLQRTLLTQNELGYRIDCSIHQSLVCVVCDEFIIGTQIFHWIKVETLQYHSNILSSSYYYKEGINQLLKLQYSVDCPQLSDLLLSPRARRDNEQNAFMCCQKCYEELSECKRKRHPPKYAISNGFAIGYIPEDISRGVTPIVNNLVAPIRAFNYFISFSGGKEQRVTGNFTFFLRKYLKILVHYNKQVLIIIIQVCL